MKVVDAVWEQRNLGIRCAEVELARDDDAGECRARLLKIERDFDYIALKVPTTRADLVWTVNSLDYRFVEDMMFLEHDLHEIKRTPIEQRLYDSVEISEMHDDADFQKLYAEIDQGSFSFDRISNDPYFGPELASKRFHNWLNDERARGAVFIKVERKGEMTGFFTIRDLGDGVYTSALGGTFMKWRKGGMGTNVQTPAEVKRRGGRKLVLGVSTNNMIQIRALIRNGFFPTHANHVFVKHVGNAGEERHS